MKRFYLLLLSSLLAFHFYSCKKQDITPIDFTRYTATDSTCSILGEADITDWTADSTWAIQETALLTFNDAIVLVDSVAGFIQISPPCPNPNDGHFTLGINTERECKMKIACVNTEMETLYYSTEKFTGGPTMLTYDFRPLTSFHKEMNYRLYYAFYNSKDSLYYKGHGDFRIE
jgi:hypothetical protein